MKYLNFAGHAGRKTIEIVIMLIDLSGSMLSKDWKPSRKAGAVQANRKLIEVKARHHPKDRVGIIGFGTEAAVLHEPVCLEDGTASLYEALNRLPDMEWTNFTAALKLAEGQLFDRPLQPKRGATCKSGSQFLSWLFCDSPPQNPHRLNLQIAGSNCLRRIIVLTDGGYNRGGSPIRIADRLKDAGVVIDCIGIGGSATDVDEDKLRNIASRNPDGSVRYCFIGDQQKLIRRYESLAQHIRPV